MGHGERSVYLLSVPHYLTAHSTSSGRQASASSNMTLSTLITQLLRPCSSAPKSPTPPSSPNADQPANGEPAGPFGVTEVTACTDISNAVPSTPSPTTIDKAPAVSSEVSRGSEASKDE